MKISDETSDKVDSRFNLVRRKTGKGMGDKIYTRRVK